MPFMLTKCEAKKIRINGKGIWISAALELEFKECVSGTPNTVTAVSVSNPGSGASSLVTWGGKTLGVSAAKIYSFEDLEISGGVKTKESEQSGIKKADADGLEAAGYSISVPLDARLGVDVQSETRSWMSLMRAKTKSNLLITGYDVFGVPFLLTKCEAKDIRATGNGTWLCATLELEFQESTAKVSSSSGGGSGGGSSKKSSKSSSTKKWGSYPAGKDVDVISMAAPSVSSSSSGSSGNLTGALGGYSAVKSVISTAKSVASSIAKAITSAAKSSASSKSSSSKK